MRHRTQEGFKVTVWYIKNRDTNEMRYIVAPNYVHEDKIKEDLDDNEHIDLAHSLIGELGGQAKLMY